MSLDTDLVVDRIRLKRRLAVWRVLAVAGFVLALLLAAGTRLPVIHAPFVGRLTVDGIITDNPDQLALVETSLKDPLVRAVILSIDSPGGSVAGGEALHDAIARLAAAKPVITVMGGTAASAGYMIAVPTARIFASNATLTGSIGVIMQSPDISGLLGKVGVNIDELVSGPLKGQPSGVKPLSPEGRAMLQGVIADLYGQFVDMVALGRHMPADKVRTLADGRPYTGRQAIQLGLIDQIGTERDARSWLAHDRTIALSLPTHDLKAAPSGTWLQRRTSSLLDLAVFSLASGLGLGEDLKTLIPQGVVLDGPIALWQP